MNWARTATAVAAVTVMTLGLGSLPALAKKKNVWVDPDGGKQARLSGSDLGDAPKPHDPRAYRERRAPDAAPADQEADDLPKVDMPELKPLPVMGNEIPKTPEIAPLPPLPAGAQPAAEPNQALRTWGGEKRVKPPVQRAEIKTRIVCESYVFGKGESASDLASFCQNHTIGETGFVQTMANCVTHQGYEVESKNLVTCPTEACEKGARACRAAPVRASQYRAIEAAKRESRVKQVVEMMEMEVDSINAPAEEFAEEMGDVPAPGLGDVLEILPAGTQVPPTGDAGAAQ